MKSFINYFIFILITIFVLFCFHLQVDSNNKGTNGSLYLYNWGEYIDPELLEKFESESGYDIVYDTFDSNEAMFGKLGANSSPYDLVFPSEYMVDKLVKKDLLEKIDYSKIVGLENIDERFLNPENDPGNLYSLPYFWGTLGILYNPNLTDIKFECWNDLWNPKLENNVILVDGTREIMGVALNSLNYSLNTLNDLELTIAQSKLFELRNNVKAIIGDEILQVMPQNEAAAAVVWSGSASNIINDNPQLEYVIPKEGSNIWLDNFVIPKNGNNKEGAYAFINFMLRPENAAQNAKYIGYSTPNKKALELMDHEVTSDLRFYPKKDITDNLEYYKNFSKENIQKYNDLFLEFKMF